MATISAPTLPLATVIHAQSLPLVTVIHAPTLPLVTVIPAQAGIHAFDCALLWIPACAGMTG